MFQRCLLILVVASLAVSGSAAWAASYFVDMSATAGLEQAWPTGVSPTGGVIMQGNSTGAQAGYLYDVYAYPAGTAAGTMTNINGLLTCSGGTAHRNLAGDMASNGLCTFDRTSQGQQGCVYTGGTNGTVTTWFEAFGSTSTRSVGIDINGDVCGEYGGGKYTSGNGWNAFIYSGGSTYFMDVPATVGTSMGDCVTAMNTNGQAVGVNLAAPVNTARATLWTQTGPTWASYTATDLQGSPTSWMYQTFGSNLVSSQALAVNASGTVVIGASTYNNLSTPEYDTGYCLYNIGTAQYTSLGSLMMYDPIASTLGHDGGHEDTINDYGQVVGYTGVQSTGTWQAAIWQNGVVTNLNTEYASILPAGFVLNNATAIDNNGDIVGYGTDASSNTIQAFEIINRSPGDANFDGKVDINDLTIVLAHYNQTGMGWAEGEFTGDGTVDINDLTIVLANYNTTSGASASRLAAVPEPCVLTLLAAGLVGLLACAWRKRR